MKERNGWFSRKLLITEGVLLALGTAAALWVHRAGRVPTPVLISDILFCQGSALLIWGIILTLGNVRMFTSFTYGFKRMHDAVKNRVMRADVMKEDYLTYRQTRRNHPEARKLLLLGAAWLVPAVLAAVLR